MCNDVKLCRKDDSFGLGCEIRANLPYLRIDFVCRMTWAIGAIDGHYEKRPETEGVPGRRGRMECRGSGARRNHRRILERDRNPVPGVDVGDGGREKHHLLARELFEHVGVKRVGHAVM